MKTLLAASVVAILVAQASAGVILTEPFEYETITTPDTRIANLGQPGSPDPSGSGWTSNWEGNAGYYDPNSLTYPGLVSTGGKVLNNMTYGNGRFYDVAPLTNDGDVQYVRVLFDYAGASIGQDRLLLFTAGSSAGGAGVEFLSADEGGQIVARLAGSNGPDSVSFDTTVTNLLVMKYTWSDTADSDQVEVWLNPDFNTPGPADLSMTGEVSGGNKFGNEIYARADSDWYMDEIVMGDTLADIGIPEPATLGLLALGGLAVLRRRK